MGMQRTAHWVVGAHYSLQLEDLPTFSEPYMQFVLSLTPLFANGN